MTLARLSLLLAFSALTTFAMAGDNGSSSQATSSKGDVRPQSSAPLLGDRENLPPKPDVALQPQLLFPGARPDLGLAPDAPDRAPLARLRTRPGLSIADRNGNVCYILRTYKVKPTESIRDRETSFRGYSECTMASTFQIRSAEAHQKNDEPPATLK